MEPGKRDPGTESQFDYGSRVAIWRIMDIFKKHNIPITFYAVARAFERNLAVAKYAEDNGHEVASHCFKVRLRDDGGAYPVLLMGAVEAVYGDDRRGGGILHPQSRCFIQGDLSQWQGARWCECERLGPCSSKESSLAVVLRSSFGPITPLGRQSIQGARS